MEMNGTTIIRRPVEVVFSYVIDLANDANWRTGLDESGLREGEPWASAQLATAGPAMGK